MTRSIKTRLEHLEKYRSQQPFIAIYQDWDDPSIWHAGSRDNKETFTSWEAAEAAYRNYDIFKVYYTDNWRST